MIDLALASNVLKENFILAYGTEFIQIFLRLCFLFSISIYFVEAFHNEIYLFMSSIIYTMKFCL